MPVSADQGVVRTCLFLRVVSADHDGVGAGSEDGANVRQKKWDPEPVVSCLLSSEMCKDRKVCGDRKFTENESSQPAMSVKRRGEKSLAGLTADPAFKPKLGILRFNSLLASEA